LASYSGLFLKSLWLVQKNSFLLEYPSTYGSFDKWGGAMVSELEADNQFLLFAIRTREAFD
jgi:hypothetical protein